MNINDYQDLGKGNIIMLKTVDDFINQYGIHVVRIPNNEIDNNFYNVCTYLDSIIKKRIKGNSSVTCGDSSL